MDEKQVDLLQLNDPIMERDLGVDQETGQLREQKACVVNYIPIPVTKGSILHFKRPDLNCSVFCYSRKIPDELVYTYSYQPESLWATYQADWTEANLAGEDSELKHDGYVRLVFSGQEPADRSIRLHELAEIRIAGTGEEPLPAWIYPEADAVAERVRQCHGESDLTVLLLTDTHDTLGGIWSDTRRSLQAVADRITPDALVHLGDFADGLLPAAYTRLFVRRQIQQLREISQNLYCCIGNHDRNAFRGNKERFSPEECAELYLQRRQSCYLVDVPEKKLRLFFLDSFDPDHKERYGFSGKEVFWFVLNLRFTPPGYKVLVFSHVTPIAKNHVWSDTIRNGEKMLEILGRFRKRRRGSVLGWIHGHNHAEQITWTHGFPVIGIGCAKLEDFTEHKPEGSVTYSRVQGTRTQELWDVLIIHPEEESLDFIRFGAGTDRSVRLEKRGT